MEYTPGVQRSKNAQLANLNAFGVTVEPETTGNNFVSFNNISLFATGPCTITTGNRNDVVTENKVSAFVIPICTNCGNDAVTVRILPADAIDGKRRRGDVAV